MMDLQDNVMSCEGLEWTFDIWVEQEKLQPEFNLI